MFLNVKIHIFEIIFKSFSMQRLAYSRLVDWKKKEDRKPLIIQGARQVGKTWLMKEFGKNEYDEIVYINFENEKELKNLFEQGFNIKRILLALSIETGVKAKPGSSLIIFDEIQEVNRGITSLKYFHENAPEYHIMVAGSYLGISQNKNSFPVGKVEFLKLEPLNFIEFLKAMDKQSLVDLIYSYDYTLISTFKSKLIYHLKQYYFIGGMPEAVKSFAKENNFETVREIHNNIIFSYEHDFAKHAPNNMVPRIKMVWNSIPSQLSKENKKFIYNLIKKGARAKEFELAIEWLQGSGLIKKVNRINKAGIPLKSYFDISAFKIFCVDIGLLGTMSGLDISTILQANNIFSEFKGALTEQFVFQQLKNLNLYYWSAENSTGEIDFIIQLKNNVIPIEVKAEENLKSKSLKSFINKYNLDTSVRISMANYRKQEKIINFPLYCLHEEFTDNLLQNS